METNVFSNGRTTGIPQKNRSTKRKSKVIWLVTGLILLSVIPLIMGALRLNELARGAEITPANARFFASPFPVVSHIVGSGVYALLGAFQFVSRFWRRGTGWHRWAGRVLVPFGLLVGLSGIWMTLFYPRPESASDLLFALRAGYALAGQFVGSRKNLTAMATVNPNVGHAGSFQLAKERLV